jgi:ABC-2 type transport system permease protein
LPYEGLKEIWKPDMQQIYYIIRKEFKQIFRTREMIAIIFVAPLIQMLVLGFAITNEVKHVKLIIADRDNSFASREIVRGFQNTDRFDFLGYMNSNREMKDAIQGWKAQMAIVIPPEFGHDLQRNLQPEIQLIVDGVDGNTAGVALGFAQGIISQFTQNYLSHPLRRVNLKKVHLVQQEERMWYNVNLDTAQHMVPGIVVVLITIISMMLSAMNIVREKELGTLEQLMVTPIKKHQLLLGKLIPFLFLTFVELAIVMRAAQIIFSIRMEGSLLLLFGLAFLFLFTTLGLGIFVSTITQSQQQAMFVSWFFMVFMLLMSGLFIPIENMPLLVKDLTYLNPMRYIMYIMRDIFQKGSSIQYLLKDAIPMTIYGLVIFTFGVLKFQKRIS